MRSTEKRTEPTSLESSETALPPVRPGAVAEFVHDIRGTWRLASDHALSVLAAGVAFFCLFSLCPFFILCSMGSHYVLGVNGFESAPAEAGDFFRTLLPSTEAWVSESLLFVMKKNVVGNILTLVLLMWSTYSLFSCLHVVFTKISVTGRRRNVFRANLVCLVCFLIVGVASTLFFMLSTTSTRILKTIYSPYLDALTLPQVGYLAYGAALACALVSLIFIFKFMPTQLISLRYAVRASVLFMALFIAGRVVYEIYSAYYRVMNQNVYGAFLGFIMITGWIYYLAHSFLFSAQYAIYLEEKRRFPRASQKSPSPHVDKNG